MCGQNSEIGNGESKNQKGPLSGSQDHRNNRSQRESIDEGYGQHDESPKPTTRSIVLVAKSEEICDVRLYFSRKKEENGCTVSHDVTVHGVLDKGSFQ